MNNNNIPDNYEPMNLNINENIENVINMMLSDHGTNLY